MKVVVVTVESLLYDIYFNFDILPDNFFTCFLFRVRDFKDVLKFLLKSVNSKCVIFYLCYGYELVQSID